MREADGIRRSLPILLLVLVAAVIAAVGVVSAVATTGGTAQGEARDDVVCDGATADVQVPMGLQPPSPAPAVAPPPAGSVELVRSYHIDVAVQPDGSARFDEQITYDFGSATARHGIFREIVLRQPCNERWDRVYPIDDIVVSSPTGAPADVSVEEEANGVRIRIGDPDSTIAGVHDYTISYRIEGIMNPFPQHEELYWNVVGSGWNVPLLDVSTVVHLPAPITGAACYTGPSGSTTACSALAADGGTATYLQPLIPPGSNLTVAAAVPAGATAAPLLFEERWSLARAFELTPLTVGGALVLLVLVVGGVALAGFRIGRDRQASGSPVDVAFAPAGTEGERVPLFGGDHGSPVEVVPPDGIRPAQMAVLLNEAVTPRDVTATIVDLAVRGALRIEQVGEGRKADYQLVLLRQEDPAWTTYESMLVGSLFTGTEGEVLLSGLEQKFAAQLRAVVDAVYTDAVEHLWFPRRPDHVRLAWRALGVVLTLITGAIAVALAIGTHLALLGVPLVVGALGVLLFAGRFPRRTPAGTGLFRRSRGFRRFIEDSEAPRARWAEQRNIFSEYLPYAIVMGEADRWARTFAPLGAEAVDRSSPAGTWFVGPVAFDALAFTAATQSFTSAAASSLSSTPPSSGSSGSGGGGSSGGGGGGGGGGSW